MKFLSMMVGLLVLAAGAIVSLPLVGTASAAPAGAATALKVTAESCTNNLATYRLAWTASGKGTQRVDLSATNNGFASNYSSGNLDTNASLVLLTSLKPGTTYYTRIVTSTPSGAVASDTVSFAASCQPAPAFSAPTGLHSSQVGKGTIRFQWTPGVGNQYYCLDTATSFDDLIGLKGSWRNHGCGTTTPSLDVSDLPCGAVVYWRVFAWGTSSGHSQVAAVSSPACVIGAPTDLTATPTGTAGVALSWTPGTNNTWFCVDVATSTQDLAGLNGSWRNYGCWMTGHTITLNNLDCGQTYYWNVYAWNDYTHTRSANASFQVKNCNSTVTAAINSVDVTKVGGNYHAKIVAVVPNACHKPAEYEVTRSGNTINIAVTYETQPGHCEYFAGTYNLDVNLGNNFVSGKTYKVVVNGDKSKSFVAN